MYSDIFLYAYAHDRIAKFHAEAYVGRFTPSFRSRLASTLWQLASRLEPELRTLQTPKLGRKAL